VDQSTLVEEEIVDGRRFIERFAADGHSVSAAAWIKADEDDPWLLFVATDLYDREGPAATYRAAHASLDKLDDLLISSSRINLISSGGPVAQDLRELSQRHPKRSGFPLRVDRLGSMTAERAYVYSPRIYDSIRAGSMTVEDISQEILRLLMHGPGVHPSARVILKDGTGFNGVPLTLCSGDHDSMKVQFIVDQESNPRIYPIGAIASIS